MTRSEMVFAWIINSATDWLLAVYYSLVAIAHWLFLIQSRRPDAPAITLTLRQSQLALCLT